MSGKHYVVFAVSFSLIFISTFAYSKTIIQPENLAFRMPVTTSGGTGQGNNELLTDGNTASDPHLGGPKWVQVDLRDEYMIDTIKLWHYWADGRTYHNNKVALSLKGDFLGEEIVVFNTNDKDAEYPETSMGKTISFKSVRARYIRAWVGGSTANEWSHWVELQAFFMNTKQSIGSGDKTPVTWGKMKSF